MKLIVVSFFLLVLSFSCNKDEDNNPRQCDTYLVIAATRTPARTTIAAGINSGIESFGANLCYSFSHTEVLEKPGKIFEIRSKGKVTCGKPICAQALYQANDSVRITIAASGTYLLKFYNDNTHFKTDTVLVD
jgi:hypothetical protein